MARPIKPTPILRGKDVKAFNQSVKENLDKPLRVTTLPSLDKAKERVFSCALADKK